MNLRLIQSRLKLFAAKPHNILTIVFIVFLLYVVAVPLVIMLQETVTVHPMERFQIRGASVGDFTWHHWIKTFFSDGANVFFVKPFINTMIISVSLSALALLVGGILAWLVVRTDIPHAKFISNLAIVPYIMPSWTLALAWLTLFKNGKIGGYPGLFEALTGIVVPDWISYGHVPIIICLSLHYFPFGFLLIGGALRNLDSTLEDAGEMLGASRWYVIRRIVAPLMLPVVFSTFLLTFSRGLGTFGTPAFLGGPNRTYVLSTLLRANLVGNRPGSAYLIALVMILFGILILYMDHKVIGARRSFVTISGKGGLRGVTSLGKWRNPVFALVLLFLASVTVFPFVLLALDSVMLIPGKYSLSNLSLHYWIGPASLDIGLGTGEPGILRNPDILASLANSMKLGLIVAVICGFLGLLIGYSVVSNRGRWHSRLLDQLSFLPYLIPSIAFGSIFLAMFALPRGPIPALYGTFTLLVVACVVKYLPYATRAGTSAMMQVGRELEEAAEVAGASWTYRMKRILIPLQKSSIMSGMLLPFISAMRELSLLVLLVTPTTNLATTITLKFSDRGWYPYTNAIMVLIVAAVLLLEWTSRRLMKTDLSKGIGG